MLDQASRSRSEYSVKCSMRHVLKLALLILLPTSLSIGEKLARADAADDQVCQGLLSQVSEAVRSGNDDAARGTIESMKHMCRKEFIEKAQNVVDAKRKAEEANKAKCEAAKSAFNKAYDADQYDEFEKLLVGVKSACPEREYVQIEGKVKAIKTLKKNEASEAQREKALQVTVAEIETILKAKDQRGLEEFAHTADNEYHVRCAKMWMNYVVEREKCIKATYKGQDADPACFAQARGSGYDDITKTEGNDCPLSSPYVKSLLSEESKYTRVYMQVDGLAKSRYQKALYALENGQHALSKDYSEARYKAVFCDNYTMLENVAERKARSEKIDRASGTVNLNEKRSIAAATLGYKESITNAEKKYQKETGRAIPSNKKNKKYWCGVPSPKDIVEKMNKTINTTEPAGLLARAKDELKNILSVGSEGEETEQDHPELFAIFVGTLDELRFYAPTSKEYQQAAGLPFSSKSGFWAGTGVNFKMPYCELLLHAKTAGVKKNIYEKMIKEIIAVRQQAKLASEVEYYTLLSENMSKENFECVFRDAMDKPATKTENAKAPDEE